MYVHVVGGGVASHGDVVVGGGVVGDAGCIELERHFFPGGIQIAKDAHGTIEGKVGIDKVVQDGCIG